MHTIYSIINCVLYKPNSFIGLQLVVQQLLLTDCPSAASLLSVCLYVVQTDLQ